MTEKLKFVRDRVASRRTAEDSVPYAVPSVWIVPDFSKPASRVAVNPSEFLVRQMDRILQSPAQDPPAGPSGDWSRQARVYNLFVRLATAYDHDGDGRLALPVNAAGLRETGTFLKSIALLPYLQALGINTLHLLPITAIGQDGKKGTLGSPYAIRNPYLLDENLCEPFYELRAETEFRAFVEAAHHLGMRVVLEFVFRTASKDSDWAEARPQWFYWIQEAIPDRARGSRDPAAYGAPIFDEGDLKKIKEKVRNHEREGLAPPPENYRALFLGPPSRPPRKEEGKWVGETPDGTRLRIPGAFADWPPDDPQPPWGDVTYLRLYDHPDFNYIAYNTVRMYDARLGRPENAVKELWERIEQILPHYQKEFGIDGAMVDMGHALPGDLLRRIVEKARELSPGFAFWEENFSPLAESRAHGYDAAIGYLWCDLPFSGKRREVLERYAREPFAVPFFGAPESHNSPRAAGQPGGVLFSRFSWAFVNMLPTMPFLHNGFELGEGAPVNTGLRFTPEELAEYPPERLGLFSAAALDWTRAGSLCGWVGAVGRVRARFGDLLSNDDPRSFRILPAGHPDSLLFERLGSGGTRLLFAGNGNFSKPVTEKLVLEGKNLRLQDLISEETLNASDGTLSLDLAPGEARIFLLQDA